MSGSPSIDPRQAGRFDISRFRESQPIYVTHRHIVHLAAAIGIRFRKLDAEKPHFREGCTTQRRG